VSRRPGQRRQAPYRRLEAEILRLGAENVAAFLAKTVVGATAGCVPAVPGYSRRLPGIPYRCPVLLILDQVGSV
jgi:adenosylmethionine-8-amino-7-oxononanoate aminotransferase